MRNLFKLAHWILYYQISFVGFKRIRNVIRGVPRYLSDLRQFKKDYQGQLTKLPCLTDWSEESGSTRGEYFWQDLYVARKIFSASPKRHVDIGSRVDGFVAQVASYREIEVLDIRANAATIPGVVFRVADLMNESTVEPDYCDSISCLHALEHFGLGRYGDRVNVDGWRLGLRNMARMLKPGGLLYLAVPSGQPCVYFNAHRVFSPCEIRHEAEACSLELLEFAICDPNHGVEEQSDFLKSFHNVESKPYALCIYKFQVTRNAYT
jgi:SAM-dependent methyltransferase